MGLFRYIPILLVGYTNLIHISEQLSRPTGTLFKTSEFPSKFRPLDNVYNFELNRIGGKIPYENEYSNLAKDEEDGRKVNVN